MARGRKGRSEDEIASNRAEIARLYLCGHSQQSIGKHLGLSQPQISVELKAVRAQWRASAIRDFDAAKEQELAKLDNLERHFWEGWERSILDRQKRVVEQSEDGVKKRLEREGQAGDPRFLKGVHDCIAERCKILGVHAAAKLDVKATGDNASYALVGKLVADPELSELADLIAGRLAGNTGGDGGTPDAGHADAVAES